MIASLEGAVGAILDDALIIEVGGIGYRVFAAPALLAHVQAASRLKLYTYHLVRDDAQALYGFANPEDLGFFTQLLTVTGVGPKVALSVIGSRPVADLQLAILQEDQAVLQAVPGVGKRLAGRIVLELHEKVAAAGLAAGIGATAGRDGIRSVTEGEVVAALQALGYSVNEARLAARSAAAATPAATTTGVADTLEDRVKAALRTLAR